MNGFLRLLLVLTMSLGLVHCVSTSDDGDDAAIEASSDDEFSEFDGGELEEDGSSQAEGGSVEDELNIAEGTPAEENLESSDVVEAPSGGEDDLSLDEGTEQAATNTPDELNLEEDMNAASVEPQVDVGDIPPPEIAESPEQAPPPIVETAPEEEEAPASSERIVRITNIRYKANDNGGTVVVDADGPLNYETRSNPDTNQFVIEIPNSELPAKLKRPFNTRDMKGGIGSIDAYQNQGSNTARIVVQLRAGVSEPTVQSEGNSLLVVQTGGRGSESDLQAETEDSTSGGPQESSMASSANEAAEDQPVVKSGLLSTSSLEQFLAGNTQFYGKKISLEVSEMDVKEVFKLISEESGVNLVISDEVKGTVSLKLRQVPWDQALVVIMKSRRLGYTRAGNVLRIAPMADLKTEEDDTLKLANARRWQLPMKVRIYPVSYAKVDDLVKQVQAFLSERGKVIGDSRTSSVVVSDLEENMDRVAKLITSIDVPPPQVLIEGKIVEASEQFQRQVGVNWSTSGQQMTVGNSRGRPVRAQTSISVSPAISASAGQINFQLGTLDILGDLNATLSLFESQNIVKVLSSPRIVTLHNEPAEINQTTEVPLIRETVSSGTVTKSVDFKSVKLRLSVVPQITNDGSVIMAVDVNRDFLSGVAEQETQARAINTRTAKTKVMVRNAQTAVIGGIYQSDQSSGENKVPWLGDIPVFGWLFKSRTTDNAKNELLIFLTPRIMGQVDGGSVQGTGGEIE